MPRLSRFLGLLVLLGAAYVALNRWRTNEVEIAQVPLDSPQGEHVEGQITTRVVAVGDLHGDMGNALKVLHMADVVDLHGNWSGKIDYFVQTGDIIDRGDDTIKLYLWMEKLRAQARSAGGDVFSHLGNHEWMNALGDWRYVYPSEIKTFGSVAARQRVLSTGRIGKAWKQNYTVASRLPLHPEAGLPHSDYVPVHTGAAAPLSHAALSFVHGGLSPTYPHLSPYPSKINEIARGLLRKLQERPSPPPHPPNPYAGLPADATPDEHGLYDANGPLWYRGWAMDDDAQVCGAIDDVLNRTGVRRLIMGHTPNFEKIVSRCGGKIIIIDTGISHAYGGALSALSITYTLTPLGPTSHAGRAWTEREVIKAVYPDRHEILVGDERTVVGQF